MKVYISGPMSGYVDHNFPAFNAAAAHLRAKGFEVLNPAEMDDPRLTHEELSAIPHADYMRRDIRVLTHCDLIYLLPGWTHSKGASLEADVARGIGVMELVDPDRELWRTFEGEPIIESHDDCDAELGDGQGSEWCEHGEQIAEPDIAEVIELHVRPRHDSFRPGDSFPNVAYVRDMTGRTAAELAEVARSFVSEQFERGTE